MHIWPMTTLITLGKSTTGCALWVSKQVGLKVASLQEQSTANRKKLADATRDFKRNSSQQADSDYATAAGNLLKQYQEEIDALTRRAKHGEAAFLDLYDKLVEVCSCSVLLASVHQITHQKTRSFATWLCIIAPHDLTGYFDWHLHPVTGHHASASISALSYMACSGVSLLNCTF